ncbi:MCE family protein [Actinomadura sp. PM05-2]|uniref:MCE family protein n=2 Tax=Actinomadura parmotrematis TaxID=2864039 RepID=A0ABS7G4H1_9ACTN|nr:MCE family protein [Actinomadura parmotrematis]
MVHAAAPPDGDAITYSAVFARTGAGLDGRSDVKVRGVTVGSVDAVRLDPDGRVRVRLHVERGVRIPAAATARIDPVSVFGPKEISLDLPPDGPALPAGGTITRTADASDPSDTADPAYELAGAIDPQDLLTLNRTLAAGLAGQGPALRRTLDNGARVTGAVHADRAELERLLAGITGVSGTLGGRGDALAATVTGAGDLAGLATDRPDQISRLLDEAARTSTGVGATLAGHGANLGRIVDGAAPVAGVVAARDRELVQLLGGLTGFFDMLSNVMYGAGPQGTRTAVLRSRQALELCGIVVDVCPAAPGAP